MESKPQAVYRAEYGGVIGVTLLWLIAPSMVLAEWLSVYVGVPWPWVAAILCLDAGILLIGHKLAERRALLRCQDGGLLPYVRSCEVLTKNESGRRPGEFRFPSPMARAAPSFIKGCLEGWTRVAILLWLACGLNLILPPVLLAPWQTLPALAAVFWVLLWLEEKGRKLEKRGASEPIWLLSVLVAAAMVDWALPHLPPAPTTWEDWVFVVAIVGAPVLWGLAGRLSVGPWGMNAPLPSVQWEDVQTCHIERDYASFGASEECPRVMIRVYDGRNRRVGTFMMSALVGASPQDYQGLYEAILANMGYPPQAEWRVGEL